MLTLQVLVEMAGGNDATERKEHEPETLAMVAWALGFFAERFKNHGDVILYLGGALWPASAQLLHTSMLHIAHKTS